MGYAKISTLVINPVTELTSSRINSMDYTISVTDNDDQEARKAILIPLAAYNESKVGPGGYKPLAVLLKDGDHNVIGGIWGGTGYGWLFVQLLVVPEARRGQGLGRELMQTAEREALARGCHGAWLDTFEFQARGFYERLGYECFGEIPNYPVGFSRFFMRKSLGSSTTSANPVRP
jgi:GNAT superfamily N-acetyltransferase